MTRCVIEIEAERVELGGLVSSANGATHQTLRLYQNGQCLGWVTLALSADLHGAASVRITDGREAGERD